MPTFIHLHPILQDCCHNARNIDQKFNNVADMIKRIRGNCIAV